MQEKRKITKEVAKRYQKMSKKGKGKILDEFIQLTGYNRSYASHILHNQERVLRSVSGVVMILDATKKAVRRERGSHGSRVNRGP